MTWTPTAPKTRGWYWVRGGRGDSPIPAQFHRESGGWKFLGRYGWAKWKASNMERWDRQIKEPRP